MKVLVGPGKTKFYMAPSVLRKAGTFFNSALKKEWKEGQERTVEMPEDDPVCFRLYAEWLYTGTIFCKKSPTPARGSFGSLVGLYILGEKVLDKDFQDCVIDAMLATLNSEKVTPGKEDINRIYTQTPTGSPLRRLRR